MEQILVDTSGNTITLVYESETDVVKVKNSGIDLEFREILRSESQKPDVVIELQTESGENDGWLTYSDFDTLANIREFWETNKVNKD